MCNERKHVYKVGDKGRLVNGSEYEVIAIIPHHKYPIIIMLDGMADTVGARKLDGTGCSFHSPMLPPKRIVYVNIWGSNITTGYPSEEEARTVAARNPQNGYIKIAHPIELD